MISRRRLFLGMGAAAAAPLFLSPTMSLARAQDAVSGEELIDAFPPLPSDMAGQEDQPDFAGPDLQFEQLGTRKPNPREIELAQMILRNSPFDTDPLTVARYFQGVGQGALDGTSVVDNEPTVRGYVRGWPVRYNPVIINFFKATDTNPRKIDGDYTSWCAAFVNWCIARSASKTRDIELDSDGIMKPFSGTELKLGTGSASSGSFRCWPQADSATDAPRPGDVIVWALAGTVKGCDLGKGHVGFFTGMTAEGRFKTLAGNQKDASSGHFAVCEKGIGKTFSRSDGEVQFHSIRRA